MLYWSQTKSHWESFHLKYWAVLTILKQNRQHTTLIYEKSLKTLSRCLEKLWVELKLENWLQSKRLREKQHKRWDLLTSLEFGWTGRHMLVPLGCRYYSLESSLSACTSKGMKHSIGQLTLVFVLWLYLCVYRLGEWPEAVSGTGSPPGLWQLPQSQPCWPPKHVQEQMAPKNSFCHYSPTW